MATKSIEKVLNQSVYINDYDVNFDNERDVYTVEIQFADLRDSTDTGELLKLRNKIRAAVNRAYKIELNFTIRM